LTALVEFATRSGTAEMPAGCLFANMRDRRDRLGPITGAHLDALRAESVHAYAELAFAVLAPR